MGGFVAALQFTPPQQPIPIGAIGTVLTVVAGGSNALRFQPGGGGGAVKISGRVTDAPVATPQNNYAPAGFGSSINRLYVDPDGVGGALTITGIAAGVDGQLLWLTNTGAADTIILSFLDAGSLAANRIFGPGGVGNSAGLIPGSSVLLQYDSTLAKWVLL